MGRRIPITARLAWHWEGKKAEGIGRVRLFEVCQVIAAFCSRVLGVRIYGVDLIDRYQPTGRRAQSLSETNWLVRVRMTRDSSVSVIIGV